MFDLPDAYRVDVNVALKDFIPKDMKPNDKKRVKDAVKSVKLEYQIAGEEIPSVNNEEYRCQVIQFYDIEVANIKNANFLATTYQNLIKPLCVIHMYDSKDEVYSLAIKRLNQTDDMQIVIEQSLLTSKYMMKVPDSNRDKLLVYLNYAKLKNKVDKVQFYKELYNLNYGHDYVMNVNDTQGDTQNGTQGGTQDGTQDKLQEQIFDMIKENSQISTSEIATKLGIGVRTVKRRIKQMTNVIYVGSGYSGHWEIKE